MIKQSENPANISAASLVRSLASVVRASLEAYIFLIICFAVLALLYTYTKMPEKWLGPSISVLSAFSVILAGFEASRRTGKMGYLHGAASGFLCALMRILLGLAIYKSYVPTDGIGKALIPAILLGALGGMAGVNLTRKNKVKR